MDHLYSFQDLKYNSTTYRDSIYSTLDHFWSNLLQNGSPQGIMSVQPWTLIGSVSTGT